MAALTRGCWSRSRRSAQLHRPQALIAARPPEYHTLAAAKLNDRWNAGLSAPLRVPGNPGRKALFCCAKWCDQWSAILFDSFFIAGFECATHRRRDGVRVDSIAMLRHDALARHDYDLAAAHGLTTVRDGLRWHLIESPGGSYDWSSWLPMLRAARESGVQVIWDLWHYGTPDWLDIFSPAFVDRAVAFAEAAARLHHAETDDPPLWCPMNEISFYAFIAGDCAEFHPYQQGRADELKVHLARTAIAMAEVLRAVDPRARLVWCDPAIHVLPRDASAEAHAHAEGWRLSQFQSLDMLAGQTHPELGGRRDLLDAVGLNFYPHNQWILPDRGVPLGHASWRPLHQILEEWWQRYRQPLLITETGAEGCGRSAWLHYVCAEVEEALNRGVPVEGICWYPITDYHGWDDGRICPTGLFSVADEHGGRFAHARLAHELARQRERFKSHLAVPAE